MAQVNYDLRTLTEGEKLWLWRHRLGLTQQLAADHYTVCKRYYVEAELGRRHEKFLTARVGLLNVDEQMALARRRCGRGLLGTATLAGVCHVTLLARERAGDPRLLAFWEGRGFRFR